MVFTERLVRCSLYYKLHFTDEHSVDTRAAHLDRSRAKAALQRLSFRIHYQRTASLRPGNGTGKPRNLHSYFASPKK